MEPINNDNSSLPIKPEDHTAAQLSPTTGISTTATSLHAAPPSVAWKCTYCGLSSPQNDTSAFWRHFESIHQDVIEAHLREFPHDDAEWRKRQVQQAFAHQIETWDDKHSIVQQPLRTNTISTEEVPLGRLSLSQNPKDAAAGNRNTPAAASTLSQSAQPSRNSSPGSRQPQQHQPGSLHHKQASRSSTFADDVEFRKKTRESREASRELNATSADDAVDDHRRKRQSANSQPLSSPALISPRQPMPIGRTRGILQAQPDSRYPDLILQPDSRGISQEQLTTEVKAIYAALTTLETKCIKLDKEQAIAAQKGPISPNVWRVLIGIHRRLLNDHHDFFLASQHPSAPPALHRLATKYNMPARMWKHAIHVFLELLRHQLPSSLEFMISFIYLAYQMMSLLLETVPSFRETWIECLGDLSRYRMAVEEQDLRDRENWGNVARYWYSLAADKLPHIGRLYHHLSILARPDPLQQNFLFIKSLTAATPFVSARDSIQTLYEPMVKDAPTHASATDVACIKTSANIYYRKDDETKVAQAEFLALLPNTIVSLGVKWKTCGVYVACVTIGALFDFGIKNTMLQAFEVGNYVAKNPEDAKNLSKYAPQGPVQTEAESDKIIEIAESFFFCTFRVVFARYADRNTYTYAHIVLCFLLAVVKHDQHLQHSPELQARARRFLRQVPWEDVCRLLNTLLQDGRHASRIEATEFPRPLTGDSGRLVEDFSLRGLVYTVTYFPDGYFEGVYPDDDRAVEYPSTDPTRVERLLWIGCQLQQHGCLTFDQATKSWQPNLSAPWVYNDTTEDSGATTMKDPMDIEPSDPIVKSGDDIDIEVDEDLSKVTGALSEEDNSVAMHKLSKEDTLLVLDSKVSLKHNDIFNHLVAHSWHVAVFADCKYMSNSRSRTLLKALPLVPKRLRQISKKYESFDFETFSDIEKQVKAKDTTAHVLNREGEMTYSFHSVPSELLPSPTSDDNEDDWQEVQITRRASDLHQKAEAKQFDLFILVSDDDAIIAYAQEAGVAVVTSEYVRATLMASKDGTRSQACSDDAMDEKAVSP